LEQKVRIKEGKKKRTEVIEKEIAFEEIKEAKGKVSFK